MVDSRFYKNNGPFTLAKVADICGAELTEPDKSGVEIRELSTLSKAGEGDIC